MHQIVDLCWSFRKRAELIELSHLVRGESENHDRNRCNSRGTRGSEPRPSPSADSIAESPYPSPIKLGPEPNRRRKSLDRVSTATAAASTTALGERAPACPTHGSDANSPTVRSGTPAAAGESARKRLPLGWGPSAARDAGKPLVSPRTGRRVAAAVPDGGRVRAMARRDAVSARCTSTRPWRRRRQRPVRTAAGRST